MANDSLDLGQYAVNEPDPSQSTYQEPPMTPIDLALGERASGFTKASLALEAFGAGMAGRSPLFAELAKIGTAREGHQLTKDTHTFDKMIKLLKEKREKAEAERKAFEDHFKFADNIASEIGKVLQLPPGEERDRILGHLRDLAHAYGKSAGTPPGLTDSLFNTAVNQNEAFQQTLEAAGKHGFAGKNLPYKQQAELLTKWLANEDNLLQISLDLERQKGPEGDPQKIADYEKRLKLVHPPMAEPAPGGMQAAHLGATTAGAIGTEQRAQTMLPFHVQEAQDKHREAEARLIGELKLRKMDASLVEKVTSGGSGVLSVGEREAWERFARNPEMLNLLAEVQKQRVLLAGDNARYNAIKDLLALSRSEGGLSDEEKMDALKQMLATRGVTLTGKETLGDIIGKFFGEFGLPYDPRYSGFGEISSTNPVTVKPKTPAEKFTSPEKEAESYIRPNKRKK